MKKVLFILAGLLLVPVVALEGSSVKIEPSTSSGLKTASAQITTVPTTVYGFNGYAKESSAIVHLVNGDTSDSVTAGNQLLSGQQPTDEEVLNIDGGAGGTSFPKGLFLNLGAGGVLANGAVRYRTP